MVNSVQHKMKRLLLVVVAAFTFSLMEIGASQCDGEPNASNKAVIVDILHLSVVRIAAVLHKTLSPFTTKMREDSAAVKSELNESEAAVTEIREDFDVVRNIISIKTINTDKREDLVIIEGRIEKYTNKTTTKLVDMNSSGGSLYFGEKLSLCHD